MSCLKYWRSQLVENPHWMPDQGHAESQRVFSAKQEAEIANIILQLANNGVPITNDIVRNIMLRVNQQNINQIENEADVTNQQLEFGATNEYLRKYRERQNISIRQGHDKKRPNATQSDIDDFREKMDTILSDDHVNPTNVLNSDETFWHRSEHCNLTWARTGEDNVHIYIDANTKAGTTVLATIDSTGKKLPLLLIGKGKTTQCENTQFGFSNPIGQTGKNPYSDTHHFTTHNESGWMNQEIWYKHLENLRQQRPYDLKYPEDSKENKIYLVCDSFPVHFSDASVQEATKNNIELIQVPKGCTDECQPLDRRIFGSMKQQARALNHKKIAEQVADFLDSDSPPTLSPQTTKESIGSLINIWDKLPQSEIENAWTLALHGCENSEDV